MSKRFRECFAASASAKQKAGVHCTAMTARKLNNKNADMDHHAVPPPANKAGADSMRDELCQHDPKQFTENNTSEISRIQQKA